MGRMMMTTCVVFVLGIATLGCGGDDAPAPMATDQTSTSTTIEAPLFTKNSSDDATSSAEPASTSTAPDSIPSGSATSGGTTTVATDSTTGVTTIATTATTTTSATTTSETPTSTDDVDAETATTPADIDAGVLAMKSFIIDLLGDGVRLAYDDIDLDDVELSCVGRAEAAGIPVDGFDDVLFDCLDDDSYDTIERAIVGSDGP